MGLASFRSNTSTGRRPNGKKKQFCMGGDCLFVCCYLWQSQRLTKGYRGCWGGCDKTFPPFSLCMTIYFVPFFPFESFIRLSGFLPVPLPHPLYMSPTELKPLSLSLNSHGIKNTSICFQRTVWMVWLNPKFYQFN